MNPAENIMIRKSIFASFLTMALALMISLQAASSFAQVEIPDRYLPPKTISKLMKLEKELITQEEIDAWNKARNSRKLRDALRSGNVSGANADVIKEAAKIQVYGMSLKSQRGNLPKLRSEIIRHLNSYAKGKSRGAYIGALIPRIEDLLDGNQIVRVQAVVLLSKLDLVEEDRFAKKAPVPSLDIVPPLVKLLNDDTQPQPVKVEAISALKKVCQFGNAKTTIRFGIAQAYVNILKKRDQNHWWVNRAAADGLRFTNIVYNTTPDGRMPFVASILIETMRDAKMAYQVRSQAAFALGRISLDGQHNMPLIAYEVTRLSLDMAQAYNSRKENDSMWNRNFANVYLSFHAADRDEARARGGLLLNAPKSNEVKSAYDHTVAVYNEYFTSKNQKVSPEVIAAGLAWMKASPPQSFSIIPNSPPLANPNLQAKN